MPSKTLVLPLQFKSSQGEARAGISKPGSDVGTEELMKAGGGHHLLEGE